MAHCKYCGRKTVWGGQRVCYTCLRGWKEKRISAYEKATKELGKLTPENHKALIKRVKQLERASGKITNEEA